MTAGPDDQPVPGVDDSSAHRAWAEALRDTVHQFAVALRQAGVACPPTRLRDAIAGLGQVDVFQAAAFRTALRVTMAATREEARIFDLVFDEFWRHRALIAPFPGAESSWAEVPLDTPAERHVTDLARAPGDRSSLREAGHEAETTGDPDQEPAGSGATAMAPADPEDADRVVASISDRSAATASSDAAASAGELERLVRTDVARLTPAEENRVLSAVAAMVTQLERMPTSRSHRAATSSRSQLDWRRTLHKATSTGEVIRLRFLSRVREPPPFVLLCDMSRSMAPYFRLMLTFAHTLVRGLDGTDVVTFSTKLSDITAELRSPTIGEALSHLGSAEAAWSSGTSIGRCLLEFRATASTTLRRRPLVAIVSDGWDGGDIELLTEQTKQIRYLARHLVWLNPRMGDPAFTPSTRGIRAIEPHVDALLPGHSAASLAAFVDWLADAKSESVPSRVRGS